jgi:hypothetical protein
VTPTVPEHGRVLGKQWAAVAAAAVAAADHFGGPVWRRTVAAEQPGAHHNDTHQIHQKKHCHCVHLVVLTRFSGRILSLSEVSATSKVS